MASFVSGLVWTDLDFEAVEEVDASGELEPYKYTRHEFRPNGSYSWYLWVLLAANVPVPETRNADLERCQANGWQRRRIIVESLGGGDGALKFNMCAKIIRRELNIAVLDIIYDTFGKVQDPLARIGARMIDSSYGQRPSDEVNVPLSGAVFTFDIKPRRSEEAVSRLILDRSFEVLTYSFGLLTESFPNEVSGGRIAVSSHCWLKLLLEFQLLGVDDGAAGYTIDEVAAPVDVAAACRGSSLLY